MTELLFLYWIKGFFVYKPQNKFCTSSSVTAFDMASTYFPTLKWAVPSAQVDLTSLFGIARGGPYCYKHTRR